MMGAVLLASLRQTNGLEGQYKYRNNDSQQRQEVASVLIAPKSAGSLCEQHLVGFEDGLCFSLACAFGNTELLQPERAKARFSSLYMLTPASVEEMGLPFPTWEVTKN